MKIYSKILLVTLPLIVIPAVIVSLISFQVSRAAVQTMALDVLNSQLLNAIDICTEQASALQEKGENDPLKLAEKHAEVAGLLSTISFGKTGYTMVLDATGFVISHPVPHFVRQNISGESWFYDIYSKDKGAFTFTWEGEKRLAQFQRFPEWRWYVITTETESELLGPVNRLGLYIIGLLVLSLLIALMAIVVLGRRITNPIQALLAGTERIRKGELDVRIKATTNDEIGTLANAFNTMTEQLREVIGSLEQRVTERTEDLERRVLQLQTASEIAREAVSTHELDTLLSRSVNLIQERFNFYHVSIYSPDEQRQYAVLRAGSGEIGKLMMQRGYRVRIGEVGIVSHVAGIGEPRVVNDVKTDFTYVKHPLLPDTASVVALPLKVGNRVIGVLDVESYQANVYTQDNVAVLQTLADQLAVAIENTRLLEELQSNLKETRTLYQRYTQESWSRATEGRKISGYQFDLSHITSFTRDLPDEIRTRMMTGHAIHFRDKQAGKTGNDHPGDIDLPDGNGHGDRSVLVVPLIMYDQLIGMLGVEDDDPDHPWSSEEIALLEAISNQVSLTLDNARLVEETQLRSDQIRLLQEITAEAASHVKLNELLDAVRQRLLTGYNLLHCRVTILDTDSGGWEDEEENTYIHQMIHTHKAIVVHGTQAGYGEDKEPQPTVLIAPLVSRGEIFGTIYMEVADPERQFGEDDLRLLEQIGLQVSAAIEVARNFEQTAHRAEYERLISQITTQMRESLDVDTVIQTAAREMQNALGLQDITIHLGEMPLQETTTVDKPTG